MLPGEWACCGDLHLLQGPAGRGTIGEMVFDPGLQQSGDNNGVVHRDPAPGEGTVFSPTVGVAPAAGASHLEDAGTHAFGACERMVERPAQRRLAKPSGERSSDGRPLSSCAFSARPAPKIVIVQLFGFAFTQRARPALDPVGPLVAPETAQRPDRPRRLCRTR
jgi:hypothetical protein